MKITRNLSLILMLGFGLTSAREAPAADIVNGWSPTTTIYSVYSLGTMNMYKLNGTTQSCGHPDFWQLPLAETIAAKSKHALLIAAFAAGKRVSLRCENSLVSDFQVFE